MVLKIMIKSITTSGQFFNISSSPSVYVNNTGNIGSGTLQYDILSQSLKIHNGIGYEQFGQTVNIEPSQMMTDVINWAYCKMQEEKELQKRIEKYPALKKSYENFKMIDILTSENNHDNG